MQLLITLYTAGGSALKYVVQYRTMKYLICGTTLNYGVRRRTLRYAVRGFSLTHAVRYRTMKKRSLWWNIQLPPYVTGPFSKQYVVVPSNTLLV